jgi:hypothetical protein
MVNNNMNNRTSVVNPAVITAPLFAMYMFPLGLCLWDATTIQHILRRSAMQEKRIIFSGGENACKAKVFKIFKTLKSKP